MTLTCAASTLGERQSHKKKKNPQVYDSITQFCCIPEDFFYTFHIYSIIILMAAISHNPTLHGNIWLLYRSISVCKDVCHNVFHNCL